MCDVIELCMDTAGIPKIDDPRIVKDGYILVMMQHLAEVKEHGKNQGMVDFFTRTGEDDQK
jgi:hypothetical protein